jgi:penicillin-binding protein 2
MGIGQGPVSVTPLHVANAMGTIARGGELLSPRLLLTGGPEQIRRKLPIRPEHIDVVKRGMWKVVNEQGGTACKYFQNTGLRVEVCGKTGTADEPSREGDMGWFAGFAPYRDPQIAFAVVVEYVEGGGAANAAPIAVELVRLCEQLGYIQ